MKRKLLTKEVEHIDITKFDARPIIDAMSKMSFTSRDLAKATEIYNMMLADKKCSIFLTLAGSTSAGGCMRLYVDLVKNNMVDAIVATGASIIDMDFFEALGFRHYQASQFVDDKVLRENYIDRIYDTYIDEEQLQACDHTIKEIADGLEPRPYSSREFIYEMGKWLVKNLARKKIRSSSVLTKTACRFSARPSPIHPPVSASCGASGRAHEKEKTVHDHRLHRRFPRADRHQDQGRNLGPAHGRRRRAEKLRAGHGGAAEILGVDAEMHKYAVQITVADVRDGACSSSTLPKKRAAGARSTPPTSRWYLPKRAASCRLLAIRRLSPLGTGKSALNAATQSCSPTSLMPSQRELFDISEGVTYLELRHDVAVAWKSAAHSGQRRFRPGSIRGTRRRAIFFQNLKWCARPLLSLSAHLPRMWRWCRRPLTALPPPREICLFAKASASSCSPKNFLELLFLAKKLAEQSGAELYTVARPEDEDWTRALLEAVDERTAIVATPHCHWTDGGLIDLPRISAKCRALGAALVIDGTQSIGALPLDVREVDADFIVTAGYKWMMGPYSFCYMYVAPRRQNGEPLEESWLNRKDSDDFAQLTHYQLQYRAGARRYDVGEHSNFMLTPIALAVGLSSCLPGVFPAMKRKLAQMTGHIAARAEAMGRRSVHHLLYGCRISSAYAAGRSHPLQLCGAENHISRRGNALRIPPHVYNTRADIDRLFDALETLVPARR